MMQTHTETSVQVGHEQANRGRSTSDCPGAKLSSAHPCDTTMSSRAAQGSSRGGCVPSKATGKSQGKVVSPQHWYNTQPGDEC